MLNWIKTLLNLAAIGIEALVRGGTLEVGAELRDGASEIVVRASGPRIAKASGQRWRTSVRFSCFATCANTRRASVITSGPM